MAEPVSSLSALLGAQHADGGWGYGAASSWAEPTCYAILALRAHAAATRTVEAGGAAAGPIARAAAWLSKLQRRDGGFAPASSVEEPTAVTSLVILSLSGLESYRAMLDPAAQWLAGFHGAETSPLLQALRTILMRRNAAFDHGAWPWFPGTAAWVAPTALAILALQKHMPEPLPERIAYRIHEGREFLMTRRCQDHGWNHGGVTLANEVPFSYPETTGLALLAMRGFADPGLAASLDRAEALYRDVPSAEGEYWLRMALLAHGRSVPDQAFRHRDWNVNNLAMRVIMESPTSANPFFRMERA